MIRKAVFILIFINITTLYAQVSGTVSGKIYDKTTNKNLIGVNIIYDRYKGVTSDIEGNFSFKTDTGKRNITFTSLGYKQLIKEINIHENENIHLDIYLIPAVEELDEVVISASKTEEKKSELTISIETLNAKKVSNILTTDIEDVIIKIPGIEILDGQASIRGGSGYSYGAGSRVLLLIDGMPSLSADADNVRWDFLPSESVSKVEIIKGASSVLYGSSALNGVINFRTTKEVLKPETKISVLYGVYDKPSNKLWAWNTSPQCFSNLSLFHSIKKNNTSVTIGSFVVNDEGYRKNNYKKLARLNLNLNQKSNKFKKLNYGIILNSMIIQKKDFFLWKDAETGGLIQDAETVLELKGLILTIDPYFEVNNPEKWNHTFQSHFQITQNAYPENKKNNSDAYSYYAEYRFWYHISKYVNLTTGISGRYSTIISNFYQDHNGINGAGFLQLNIYPVEKLKIITGIRLEQYNLDGISERIQPLFRTGLNYHIYKYTFIRTSFGQGYRYPSIAEKYAYTQVGSNIIIFPNPEIVPETGWNAEIGIKQGIRFGGWNGQIDVAGFYSEYKNMIEYTFGLFPIPDSDISNLGFQAQNKENARIYGLEPELFLKKRIGPFLIGFEGGYTYIAPYEFNRISSVTLETPLKYRSKHSAKLSLSGEYKNFEIDIYGIYKSKTLEIDKVFLDSLTREDFLPGFYEYWNTHNKGYTVMDVNISYNISKRYSFSFLIKNTFNTEYMGRPGDIRPVRSYSIQGSMHF